MLVCFKSVLIVGGSQLFKQQFGSHSLAVSVCEKSHVFTTQSLQTAMCHTRFVAGKNYFLLVCQDKKCVFLDLWEENLKKKKEICMLETHFEQIRDINEQPHSHDFSALTLPSGLAIKERIGQL